MVSHRDEQNYRPAIREVYIDQKYIARVALEHPIYSPGPFNLQFKEMLHPPLRPLTLCAIILPWLWHEEINVSQY